MKLALSGSLIIGGLCGQFARGGYSTATGRVRVDRIERTYPNGTYDAKVSIYDPKTGRYVPKAGNGVSTMFPDHWSVDRIKVEGARAFENGNRVKGTTHKFRGDSPSGIKIEWFVDKNSGRITNFYPQKGK
ncbi:MULTISPECIES: EndoU domain-containing protein [Eikenella]|uniref:EndoU domain-containing protein n=1 Tax=Eikenella TaxID=538 RepID=UPI001CE4ABB0|nr:MULTISPECIES: EndoU domain-containing protein [Eikenella]